MNFDTYAAVNTIEAGITSAGTWIFAGVILTARTGLDYRRLQNHEIEPAEFNRNLRENTAGTIGSVVGSFVGIAVGIPIGGYIYDTVGSVLGAAVLGVTGGMVGEQVMVSAEQKLENALIAE